MARGLLTGQRHYIVHRCLLLNFILFRWLICLTAQGVLLRQRHSRSNINHLYIQQSIVHSSLIILIVLFDRKLWLAFHLADPVVTKSSSMACCLFGFSPDNVFTTFWTMDIVLTRVLICQRCPDCYELRFVCIWSWRSQICYLCNKWASRHDFFMSLSYFN